MRFLYFTPIAHRPFLSTMSTLLELPTSPLATRPPLHLGMPSAFSLFHCLFHNKSLFVWFYLGSISLISTGIALGFSLPIFMACIKWSQSFTTYFGQRCLPSRAPPKRSIGWILEINPPPPPPPPPSPQPPNHTLCKSLNHKFTSLALARYRLVVLRPKCDCPITSYFVFFLSHVVLAANVWPCLILRPTFVLPVFIFYGRWHGLIGLAPLLPLLGSISLFVATFCRLAH